MDDMTSFERQLSSEVQGLMGPTRSIDDRAIYEAVASRSRKRRLRWPLPHLGRRARAASDVSRVDVQPTPIPTTIIGRTHAMLSPVTAITAGALVFAIGSMLLIAQPFGQQGATVPGATSDAEAPWAAVTGTSACGLRTAGVEKLDAPPYSLTNQVLTCWDVSSDPRVSGPSTVVINVEGWDLLTGRNAIAWIDYSIEGPDGTWAGHQYGLYDDEGVLDVMGILAGDGAYEGLTFTLKGTVPAGGATLTYDGLIQPGTLPPGFPAATFPEPASE